MSKGKKTGGGSRHGRSNKATADIRALAQSAPEAMKELYRIATSSESDTARVSAIKELFDRGYGKSAQKIDANVAVSLEDLVRASMEK